MFLHFQEGTRSEHEDCYGALELVRNSEYSKSDDFKKLPLLAQILSLVSYIPSMYLP